MTEYVKKEAENLNICLIDFDWKGHHTPYALLLTRYLRDNGHDVTFVTAPNHEHLDDFERIDGLDIITLWKSTVTKVDGRLSILQNQTSRLIQMLECEYFIKKNSFDIVHLLSIDYQEPPFNIFSLLNKSTNVPLVVTLHRDHFLNHDGTPFSTIPKTLSFKSLKLSVNSGAIQSLVVHNEEIRRRLANVINSDVLSLVPCPTSELSTEATKTEAREELQLPSDRPIFLFFGELRQEKGVDLLISAANELNSDGRFNVVIAGPEVDYSASQIDNMIDTTKGKKILNRSGYVPEHLVDLYFVAADALILPYRRQKGISGPLRLACMAGIHIIGPNDSDIGSIINSNNLGQTFKLGSQSSLQIAMKEFLQNIECYPRSGVQRYRQRVHWKTSGKEFENIYHRLTQRKD